MNMSHTELTAAFKRSFEGLGLQQGDYEDAAQMIVWAEAYGLAGLKEFEKGLSFLVEEERRPARLTYEEGSVAVIDARNNSVLNCGGQAIDLAYAKALKYGLGVVQLSNCHNRKLIIERLANCGRRGMACFAYWRNGSDTVIEHVVSVASGSSHPHYRHYAVDDGDPDGKQTLHILCAANLSSLEGHVHQQLHEPSADEFVLTPEQMEATHTDCLEGGILVDSTLLEGLDDLTKRILVESTEQSRLGAGD